MDGIPADIGDWGLVRVFFEGIRLLWRHVGDFLPVIVIFIFPASLAKAVHTQFFPEDFGGHQGSEPPSFWIPVLRNGLFEVVTYQLLLLGFFGLRIVLKELVYVCDSGIIRYNSFCTTVKLVFNRARKSETVETAETADIESTPLIKPPPPTPTTTGLATFFKTLFALIVCLVLYFRVSCYGLEFQPEAIAAMGLPSWSIYLFTLLLTISLALVTSYVHLVVLVLDVWTSYPDKPKFIP